MQDDQTRARLDFATCCAARAPCMRRAQSVWRAAGCSRAVRGYTGRYGTVCHACGRGRAAQPPPLVLGTRAHGPPLRAPCVGLRLPVHPVLPLRWQGRDPLRDRRGVLHDPLRGVALQQELHALRLQPQAWQARALCGARITHAHSPVAWARRAALAQAAPSCAVQAVGRRPGRNRQRKAARHGQAGTDRGKRPGTDRQEQTEGSGGHRVEVSRALHAARRVYACFAQTNSLAAAPIPPAGNCVCPWEKG